MPRVEPLTASQYDALGRRVSKTVGSTLTYLYDGANLVQEKSAGSPSSNILTGSLDEVFLVRRLFPDASCGMLSVVC
jgi:hypothetical protein